MILPLSSTSVLSLQQMAQSHNLSLIWNATFRDFCSVHYFLKQKSVPSLIHYFSQICPSSSPFTFVFHASALICFQHSPFFYSFLISKCHSFIHSHVEPRGDIKYGSLFIIVGQVMQINVII
jgi:hypothetical protein